MSSDEQDPKETQDHEAGGTPPEVPAKKPARARKAPAAEVPAAKGESAAAEKSAAKKPASKKPAAKDSAAKASAAKGSAANQEAESKADPASKKPEGEAPKAKAAGRDVDAGEQPAGAAKPASKARRSGAKEATSGERRMAVHARARYVRTSARKARMVCGHLRGKSVQEARAILAFTPREVARDWSKLLESAVANAENNHELLEDDLIVREAYADEGPTIKRFRPRAMGRATPIRKRTSHLTITLTPRP
jgi:ribosomal protein L22